VDDFRAETPVIICSLFGSSPIGWRIMLCSVGVGTFTKPLTESRLRVCWLAGVLPACGGWSGGSGVQVAVHQGDGGRAFADGGGDTFDRSAAHVTGCEYPRQAGL
jgi:hypothetical protein